jgi:long-chain acyl-CoA synthetase
MHPSHQASARGDKPAAIMAQKGCTLTYAILESRSNQGAHYFRTLGLRPGDTVAAMIDNRLEYFEGYWAAQRSGLYIVPVSTRLTAEEAAYIIADSGALAMVVSPQVGFTALRLSAERETLAPALRAICCVGGALAGAIAWEDAIAAMPVTPIADQSAGMHMVYSSGTTGRPKGIRLPLSEGGHDADTAMENLFRGLYGDLGDAIYLSPAPLYHAAPLSFCTVVQRFGGTAVVMEKFEPEALLATIERYRVTIVQMVPTMFVRLLKLPDEIRARYDLSSLQRVVHAAAPCAVSVKHRMIEWLGPIVEEYYSGSEGSGSTYISSEEWLRKPGSVGRSAATPIHICDDDGRELPIGEDGLVYFEGGMAFAYHNDDQKTASSRHPEHPEWSTLGDIGRIDEDGYLFLSDRKAFMIISGGVNIYPQEAENVLIGHPAVMDAAVIGVPDAEMGETVKAVVQPVDWDCAGPDLERELIAHCRTHLSSLKCPRSIDFDRALPRHETGKLYKKAIRERYWASHESRIL